MFGEWEKANNTSWVSCSVYATDSFSSGVAPLSVETPLRCGSYCDFTLVLSAKELNEQIPYGLCQRQEAKSIELLSNVLCVHYFPELGRLHTHVISWSSAIHFGSLPIFSDSLKEKIDKLSIIKEFGKFENIIHMPFVLGRLYKSADSKVGFLNCVQESCILKLQAMIKLYMKVRPYIKNVEYKNWWRQNC